MRENLREDTLLLCLGLDTDTDGLRPDSPAIYPATAYVMRDTDHYNQANSGQGGYVYNRTANPNRDALAQAISALEKGEESLVYSSGMAAIANALITFTKAGDHILASKSIYGETIEVIDIILSRFGVEASYVDFLDLQAVRAAVRPNTTVMFAEVIANPLISVADIGAIAAVAREAGAMLMVDSTFTTPFVIRPLEYGADLVIHSLTKFFGGHSDLTAGSVTGSAKLIQKLLPEQRLLGGCGDPQTAWLALRSIRTMGLRVQKQLDNALALARWLAEDPRVRYVNYPGLETHPQHELASRVLRNGYGPMLSFRVKDDLGLVNEFMHRLKLVEYLGTLGGVRTSIAHPATAFRLEFTPEQLIEQGMHEGLIRISTGIEDVRDLIEDFSEALAVFA